MTTMKIEKIADLISVIVLSKVEILRSTLGTKDPMKQEFFKGEAKGAMDALLLLKLISKKQHEYFISILEDESLHFDQNKFDEYA